MWRSRAACIEHLRTAAYSLAKLGERIITQVEPGEPWWIPENNNDGERSTFQVSELHNRI